MLKRLAAVCVLAASFWSCQKGTEVVYGTEIPNELVGRVVTAGKGPAADAEVRFIPVGYVPGGANWENARMPNYTVRTDESGRFKLSGALPGQYNILASKDSLKSLRDSVAISETGQDLGVDTLLVPGSLLGTVALQPNHDPRSATVHVLGTNLFVNVDSAGGFLLSDLAPGSYRLRIETSLDGYTALYAPVEARSGRTDTLWPLRPFYAFMPVVTGLQATTLEGGHIRLTWDRPTYLNTDGYLIYRDSARAILPSTTPIVRVEDNVHAYVDTLFRENPLPGQYPASDTSIREFTYRVRLLDRGGGIGPAYAKTSAMAYSEGKVFVSAAWRMAADSVAFGARAYPAVVEFKDRLWLFGGFSEEGIYYRDVWSSADGITWTRELESLPIEYDGVYQVTVFKSRIWLLAREIRGDSAYAVCYSSADGRAWSRIGGPEKSGSLVRGPETPVWGTGIALTTYRDRLWLIQGEKGGAVFSSSDGVVWTQVPGYTGGADPGVLVFRDRLWVMGSSATNSGYSHSIWSTVDGSTWKREAIGTSFLPRIGYRIVMGDSGAYAIGGSVPRSMGDDRIDFEDRSDQVWMWEGKNWHLFDSHAPFGRRRYPGVAYFQRKIWCIGGLSVPSEQTLGDVWVMDSP